MMRLSCGLLCADNQVRTAFASAIMLPVQRPNSVDEYGLPVGVLCPHPNEFYCAIGRVVCVCAVLEDKVTTLRHTLERAG